MVHWVHGVISTMPVCTTSLQVLYPAEAGGSCDAWASMMQWFILQNPRHFSASSFVFTNRGEKIESKDLDNHPQCAVNGTKPEWCNRNIGTSCMCAVVYECLRLVISGSTLAFKSYLPLHIYVYVNTVHKDFKHWTLAGKYYILYVLEMLYN